MSLQLSSNSDGVITRTPYSREAVAQPINSVLKALSDSIYEQMYQPSFNLPSRKNISRIDHEVDSESSDSEHEVFSGIQTPETEFSEAESFISDIKHSLAEFKTTLHSNETQLSTQPNTNSSPLTALPTELHFLIFSNLDPIESTCLGLTSPYFYSISQSIHGTVPLQTRRRGPNLLERPWGLERASVLEKKHECRQCGTQRCQLYMHLRDWVPTNYEYCNIRGVFGLKPKEEEGNRWYCYRSNPSKPGVCGRHLIRDV